MLKYFDAPLVGSEVIVPDDPIEGEEKEKVREYGYSYCYHNEMIFNTGADKARFENLDLPWSIRFEGQVYDYSYCRHAYMQDFVIESDDPNMSFKWCPRITNGNRCE